MGARLRSWWQTIRKLLAFAGIIVACVLGFVLIVVIIGGYLFHWSWTGITTKTLWDWLNLLGVLAIPVVVGFGAVWFTTRQGKVTDAENKDNQREAALQAYIDKISELLLKEHLGDLTADGKLKPEYEQVRNIARVQTLTVLRRLDGSRKAHVLQFLQEAGLISKDQPIIELSKGGNLVEADLWGVNLSGAQLSNLDLSRARVKANLSEANLSGSILSRADIALTDLRGANLSGADLDGADFYQVDLRGANLNGANLGASPLSQTLLGSVNRSTDLKGARLIQVDLSSADLSGADLSKARLIQVDLSGANLSGANLKDATGISVEELEKQAKSLKGATMPDGSIHP